MAISATQIATTNTLENFRQQFNNLQTDVNGLESGTLTFSSVSATTTSTSALNILEDGTIVFEGATDDGNETTLTVADPTADRTITLPDATGTVFLTATTDTAIINKDKNAYNLAKRRAEEAQRQRDEIRGATREINNLKCEMHEIKSMLKTLLERD